MSISTNTVTAIIGQADEVGQATRKDQIEIDPELVSRIGHILKSWPAISPPLNWS